MPFGDPNLVDRDVISQNEFPLKTVTQSGYRARRLSVYEELDLHQDLGLLLLLVSSATDFEFPKMQRICKARQTRSKASPPDKANMKRARGGIFEVTIRSTTW